MRNHEEPWPRPMPAALPTRTAGITQLLTSTSCSIPYIETNRHIATIRRIVTNVGSLLREHLVEPK